MSALKSALMREVLPRVRVAIPDEGFLDVSTLFGRAYEKVWMEVGFGGGEHLAAMAARYPDIGFIGCEIFENGVAKILVHVEQGKLGNVRVHPHDARALLDRLPDRALDRCFVLYPDPWPKKRHHERRFICEENLDRLARTLRLGGQLRLATDVAGLAAWMREHVERHGAFSLEYDGTEPPADWVGTRYEEKGKKAGRESRYMICRRIG